MPVLTLTATAAKVPGGRTVTLTWSGPAGATVDVYRDGVVIAIGLSASSYTDRLDPGSPASYTYRVCLAGTTTCSTAVTVRI